MTRSTDSERSNSNSVDVSVVVPVFNSERSLTELVERTVEVFSQARLSAEIILVDDGSRDSSWLVIKELAALHTGVVGLSASRNYGQHNALLAGIRESRGDVIVTIDDDLEQRPEEIPRLLAALEDSSLVYGKPAVEVHGFLRNAASKMMKAAMSATLGRDVSRNVSAFRAFHRDMIPAFALSVDPFVNLDVLLSWATTAVAAVDVTMDERAYGTSNYSFRKLLRHALNMITGYSALPLRLVSSFGFGFALLGFGLLAYVAVVALVSGRQVPGFAFIAGAVTLFSGAQLFALGVLGEYLGRMHFRSMGRPPFVIRDRIGDRGVANDEQDGPSL